MNQQMKADFEELFCRHGFSYQTGLRVLKAVDGILPMPKAAEDPPVLAKLPGNVALLASKVDKPVLRTPKAAKPAKAKSNGGDRGVKTCAVCHIEKGVTGFVAGTDTCRKCHSTTSAAPSPVKANGTPKLVLNVLPAEAKKIESGGDGLTAIKRSVLSKLDRARRDVAHLSVGGTVRWTWTRAELEAAVGAAGKAPQ